MKIHVRNRAEAIRICDNPKCPGGYAMISIATPGKEYTSWPHTRGPVKAILHTEFYDVGVRDPENLPWITGGAGIGNCKVYQGARKR